MASPQHTRTPIPPNTYKQVQINDTTIHYEEYNSQSGSLPTLILCHAHISDLRSFTAIIPFLTPHFHIINYSRRYSWPNTPIQPSQHDDWQAHAHELASLITTLPISRPVHILGSSSGAVIPLMLATTHPSLVSSLILLEPPLPRVFLPSLPPSPFSVAKLLFTHPTAFLPILFYGINVVAPTITHAQSNPPNLAGVLDSFVPGACSLSTWTEIKSAPDQSRMRQVLDNADVLVNLFRYQDIPVFGEEELRQVTCPVFMMTGEETVSAAKCMDWKTLGALGSKVKKGVSLKGARHLGCEDQPEAVAEGLRKWVEEIEGAR
jgi:pimeloyl-ACP methyl ester carboxylesterase